MRRKANFLFFTALWAFVIWPNLLIMYWHFWAFPIDGIKAMLLAVSTLMAGPLGAHFYSVKNNRDQINKGGNDDGTR